MRRIIATFLLAFAVLTAAGCSKSFSNNVDLSDKEETDVKKSYSVLFIGNSYTYYNDMPTEIFGKFAQSAGYDVDVTAITNGGYRLYQFADPSDKYGARVEAELSGDQKYDYVILQEQSILPASEDCADFYEAVRALAARVRKAGATPVLYATWGRKEGNPNLEKYGWTNENMTWKIAAAYQAIGDELDISVAYAGLAFYDVNAGSNDIELYDPDRSHPSYSGSYLAAATLFAKIFDEDPTVVPFVGNLSEADANVLCTAAKNAVFKTPSVPDEYKTISE